MDYATTHPENLKAAVPMNTFAHAGFHPPLVFRVFTHAPQDTPKVTGRA